MNVCSDKRRLLIEELGEDGLEDKVVLSENELVHVESNVLEAHKIQRLLRKAETILRLRTDRILLVLERPLMTDNYLGCLRTAECMGIQNVWVVVPQRQHHKSQAPPPPPPGAKQELRDYRRRVRLSRNSSQWLDVREFRTTTECIEEIKQEGWTVWATDLSESSVSLMEVTSSEVPLKLAIVMGREADGVTEEMLAVAEKRVYLPLAGFNTSLNLQVATGMVLQQLLSLCPSARGDMSEERRANVRKSWYSNLARSDAQREMLLSRLEKPPAPYESIRHVPSA
jgi:tRNA G18 (ribose-2'-O)-methylase SpoU